MRKQSSQWGIFQNLNMERTKILGTFSASLPEDNNDSTLMSFWSWLDNTHEDFKKTYWCIKNNISICYSHYASKVPESESYIIFVLDLR